jgi:hypothetical protein
MTTTEIINVVPKPSRLREAIALNLRERRALELALRTSEFIASEVVPMAELKAEQEAGR